MGDVIDLREVDGAPEILTETTGSGLFGSTYLHDQPLESYVGVAETPQFVVDGGSTAVQVDESFDPDAETTEFTEIVTPTSDYRALALVTDVRILFVVGRADGDRTVEVQLQRLVRIGVDEAEGQSSVELTTIDDERYRFDCGGELAPVSAYVEAAMSAWTQTLTRFERARELLEEAESSLDDDDPDDAITAIVDARELMRAARETARETDATAMLAADRAAKLEPRTDALERRAHVARAKEARERAQQRWDDGNYEEAYARFERADEAYAAAYDIDATEPADEEIEDRRDEIDAEFSALESAPKRRAIAALDGYQTAEDPATRAEQLETALERHEALRTLDWGRDECRFEMNRDAVRDRLATIAKALVIAYCEVARNSLDAAREALDTAPGEESTAGNPAEPVGVARAEQALDRAREIARERTPKTIDVVESVETDLDQFRERHEFDSVTPAEFSQISGDSAEAGEGDEPEDEQFLANDTSPDWTTVEADGEGKEKEKGEDKGEGEGEREREREVTESPEGSGRVAEYVFRAVARDGMADTVAELLRARNWSSKPFDDGGDDQYDLLAETTGPIGVRAAVWTVEVDDPTAPRDRASGKTLDAGTIDRCAETVADCEEADVAVVATSTTVTDAARERAAETGVRLLDREALATEFERLDDETATQDRSMSASRE